MSLGLERSRYSSAGADSIGHAAPSQAVHALGGGQQHLCPTQLQCLVKDMHQFYHGLRMSGVDRSLEQRVRVTDVATSVCRILVDGQFAGSGFVIGAAHVMTCAHVLRDSATESWASLITCSFQHPVNDVFDATLLFPGEDLRKDANFMGAVGFDVAILALARAEPALPPLVPLKYRDPPRLLHPIGVPQRFLQAVTLVGYPGQEVDSGAGRGPSQLH